MSLNVLNNWNYCKCYYLTHPWLWIKELYQNLRAGYLRATKGWCGRDVWNMDDWILEVFPPMLRHMADQGMAYPGAEPFDTSEKWHDWLHSTADVLESLQGDNWYSQNEYEEEFHKHCDFHRETSTTENGMTVTWSNGEDFDTIKELYFMRMKELTKERDKLIKQIFSELGRNFFFLWD